MPSHNSPHERRVTPADDDTTNQPETASGAEVARPTHRLNNIRCGGNGIQLLVSTRDHLYDANEVEAGDGSWQVVGAWSDESAPELTRMLSQRSSTGVGVSRQNSGNVQPATRPQPSSTSPQAHFDRGGQRLGTLADRSGNAST